MALVARAIAPRILPVLGEMYRGQGVELRGCEETRKHLPQAKPATEEDWTTEYLAPVLTVGIVDGLDEQVDVVVSGHTHAAYICERNGKLLTSASSFGRLITDIDLVIDHQTKDVTSATAARWSTRPSGRWTELRSGDPSSASSTFAHSRRCM